LTELREVKATLDFFPPSVNKLYVTVFKTKKLSAAGRKFKVAAQESLLKQWLFSEPLGEDTPKELTLKFFFPELVNTGWPKSAKRRYKKKDASNYIKLIEDVVAKCVGADDSSTLDYIIKKREDRENPRVEITLREIPEV
jgi:Holliday junction resolvase RusA-like endonuclease